MDKITILREIHPISKKEALFEDHGHSGWLYLTKPDSPVVVSDAWIYNRIPAPDESQITQFKTASPPAIKSYAHTNAEFTPLASDIFKFKWSPDGRSVALLINSIPFGFIPPGMPRGYSRHLTQTGPWGHDWDEQLYAILFKESGWTESIPEFF